MNIPLSNRQIPYSSVADVEAVVDYPPRVGAHQISAIYPSFIEADSVFKLLRLSGFSEKEITIVHNKPGQASKSPAGANIVCHSDVAIKDVLVDSVIGSVVGAGLGALGTIVLMTAGATLFVASPIIAPMALIGNLASAGGLIGGAVGAVHKDVPGVKHTKFSDVVLEAIKAGNVLLMVNTYNERDQELAKKIINNSLKGRDEIPMETDIPV